MKKYYVNENECFCIEDAISEVKDEICEDEFERYLEDEYDYEVDVCGHSYNAVEVLREMGDFDDAFDEWKDEQEAEIERELNSLYIGGQNWVFGVEIRLEDTDLEAVNEARKHIEAIDGIVRNSPFYEQVMAELLALSEFVDKMESRIEGENDEE